MEASEQPEPTEGIKRMALRQVDPARIIEEQTPDRRASGFAHLHLMTHTVLDRLLAADPSRPER